MPKIILTICFCLLMTIFARPTLAGTCDGGQVITGVENDHEYCVSSSGMTWWSAFAWCKKQGRELASLQQACDFSSATGDNACPNLKGTGSPWVWTANPSGSSNAYYVNLSSGNVNGNASRYNGNGYALCF